jgi:hypothetical protein
MTFIVIHPRVVRSKRDNSKLSQFQWQSATTLPDRFFQQPAGKYAAAMPLFLGKTLINAQKWTKTKNT